MEPDLGTIGCEADAATDFDQLAILGLRQIGELARPDLRDEDIEWAVLVGEKGDEA